MRVLTIFVDVFAALVGIAFAVMAVILLASVASDHLTLLRSSGALLVGVVAVHFFPLRPLTKRSQLISYLILAIVAAWGFGTLYFFATADDPFRRENELFADMPFRLAFFLSIVPTLRTLLKFRLLGSIVNTAPRSPV
jgi:hypothetical protein